MPKRQIEILTGGCPVCEPAVQTVKEMACPDCEITVYDLSDPANASKARQFGIKTVPAVIVNGSLVSCCENTGPQKADLQAAGIGQPLP